MTADCVGRFEYGAKFFERYALFFEACKALPENAKVWIIGANDGELADPARYCWQPGWRGTFLEPQPDVAASLAARVGAENVVVAALDSEPGTLRLWRMRPDLAEAYVRVGAHGSALTSISRAHIIKRVRMNLAKSAAGLADDEVIEPINVPRMTPEQLMQQRGHPDLIQVDVEGMESRIVPDLIRIGPQIIMWEVQHLAKPERSALARLAQQRGYEVTTMANDAMAVRPC
jgi:FkbM family methyltransferase